jgi:hypothetical protein
MNVVPKTTDDSLESRNSAEWVTSSASVMRPGAAWPVRWPGNISGSLGPRPDAVQNSPAPYRSRGQKFKLHTRVGIVQGDCTDSSGGGSLGGCIGRQLLLREMGIHAGHRNLVERIPPAEALLILFTDKQDLGIKDHVNLIPVLLVPGRR